MELGCDVITEKPMTNTDEKCRQIIEAQRKFGKRITVSFNYRYSPARTQVKDLLMSGAAAVRRRRPADSMARMAQAFPSLLLGAGTVLTVDQVKRAVDSGARFIVSPSLDSVVVEYCLQHGITVAPGVLTPTEIQAAVRLGLEVVKFFPAEPGGRSRISQGR